MNDFSGELAALGTAICFSFGSVMFTFAGREIGSPLVNRARLLVAMLGVMLLHWLLMGEPVPLDAGAVPWFWLGVSGFVGLAAGDAFLFQAFVLIGPRLSMLLMALAPVMGAVLAWLFLGETLQLPEIAGITLTIVGIAWVVSENRGKPTAAPDAVDSGRTYFWGIICGLGGAAGQAGGLVLSKIGLANDFPALSGNVIRLAVALILIWLLALVRGQGIASFRTLRAHPRAVLFLTGGAIMGPISGVWLSLIAVQRAPIGVASALMALTPIFLIPISRIVFKERVSSTAIFGTLLAFAGTVLLFV
jgi:drug/metabolite transporter (DMT)-like permease